MKKETKEVLASVQKFPPVIFSFLIGKNKSIYIIQYKRYSDMYIPGLPYIELW